ncbi:MAG: hypothetical protein OJF47_002902 [Nitrospira sp.]|nr:MAG: hypothetical protein OJF47_002902 [Nitrospira sp.]
MEGFGRPRDAGGHRVGLDIDHASRKVELKQLTSTSCR